MTDPVNLSPAGPASGRFSHVLRAAIQASGLSLNRIQYRLRERGLVVSSATLSYWQSGRRRPTRQESVLVVRTLEEVLRVPDGTLTGLLEPPGARRRPGPRPSAQLEAVWRDLPTADAIREHLTGGWEAGLARISVHDRYEVGPDRRIRRIWHRLVLRAEQDGPDRWVLIFREESPDDPLPEVRAVWHCRVGAVTVERQPRLLVAELLFGRALSRGETFVMEYELGYPDRGAVARDKYERKFRFPVREHVMELVFDPAAMPARCQLYSVPAGVDGREQARTLPIEPSGYVHAVAIDVAPCIRGVRWEWPPVNS